MRTVFLSASLLLLASLGKAGDDAQIKVKAKSLAFARVDRKYSQKTLQAVTKVAETRYSRPAPGTRVSVTVNGRSVTGNIRYGNSTISVGMYTFPEADLPQYSMSMIAKMRRDYITRNYHDPKKKYYDYCYERYLRKLLAETPDFGNELATKDTSVKVQPTSKKSKPSTAIITKQPATTAIKPPTHPKPAQKTPTGPYFKVFKYTAKEKQGFFRNIDGSVSAAARPTGNNSIKVEATGVGTSSEDALKDALKNSVMKAVGLYCSAEEQIQNEEVIKDQILTYSNGFVTSYDRISTLEEGGLFTVKVRAVVVQQKLESRLKSANLTFSRQVKGKALFAESVTKANEKAQALKLYKKLWEDYPKNIVSSEITPFEMYSDNNNVMTLTAQVKISVDPEKYKAFTSKVSDTLGYLCRGKCAFTLSMAEVNYTSDDYSREYRALRKLGYPREYYLYVDGGNYENLLSRVREREKYLQESKKDSYYYKRYSEEMPGLKLDLERERRQYYNNATSSKLLEFWTNHDLRCFPFRVIKSVDYRKKSMLCEVYALPKFLINTVPELDPIPITWSNWGGETYSRMILKLMLINKNGQVAQKNQIPVREDVMRKVFNYNSFKSPFSQMNQLSGLKPYEDIFLCPVRKGHFSGSKLFQVKYSRELSPHWGYLSLRTSSYGAEVGKVQSSLVFPIYIAIDKSKVDYENITEVATSVELARNVEEKDKDRDIGW